MTNTPLPGKPLPRTGAVTGLKETFAFFRDPSFTQQRFEQYGDVFETRLLAQRIVFIRGEQAIGDLFNQSESLEGWWPESVRQLLGSRSLANRSGADHKARRRVVGQLFSSAALERYTPSIEALIEEVASELLQTDTAIPLAERMRRFAFAVIASRAGAGPQQPGCSVRRLRDLDPGPVFHSRGTARQPLRQGIGGAAAAADAPENGAEKQQPQAGRPRSAQRWPG